MAGQLSLSKPFAFSRSSAVDVAQDQDVVPGPDLKRGPRHRKELAAPAPESAMRQDHVTDGLVIGSQDDVLDGSQSFSFCH